MAMLHAGYPFTTAFNTVNRQCSSGLQAITSVAASIQTGMISVGIGGGVESMTRNYGSRAVPQDLSPELRRSPIQDALDCIMVCPTSPAFHLSDPKILTARNSLWE
jgi:acetyl-CoA acyltransferase 1